MQQIIVYLLLTAALAYLLWRFYKTFFSKKEGCDHCGFNNTTPNHKQQNNE